MGKILTNPQGKAIIASGNAFAASAALDANIIPGNIKDGVEILGVTGNYQGTSPNLTTLNVTPSTSAQQLTPTSPVDGYNEVNVGAVTSAIDQNIVAGNIKKDVAILGVTGTYEGSGGGLPEAPDNDVIFIDYDGTIRYSYSAAEFAQLSAMPANPTHQGLTAQGWNWSLADAKEYVASYKRLVIGQMYVSDDGKTKLYINIKDISRPTMSVYFRASVDGGVTIDWGDGSATTTSSGTSATTYTHDYASVGNYVISLNVTSGTLSFTGSSTVNICGDTSFKYNWGRLRKVVIGSGVTSIGDSTFYGCCSLASITIPSGVTSIGSSTFYNCYSLASITIPSGVTSIGNSAFNGCYSLASITISSGVTSIGSSVFNYCSSLASITIPDSVTSIGNSAFNGCCSLASITIPDSVTSISSSAFNNCTGVKYYYVKPTTPPTISSSTFNNNASDVIIYVPAGSVNDYKTTSNWSSYASKIYAMPA